MDGERRGRTALVWEPGSAYAGAIGPALARLGWCVRSTDRGPGALVSEPADLWAVNLAALRCPPRDPMHALVELRAAFPLLLVLKPYQLAAHRPELDGLRRLWPAAVEVLVGAPTPEELEIRLGWLEAALPPAETRGTRYALGALTVEPERNLAMFERRRIPLHPIELLFLAALVGAGGRTLSKRTLIGLLGGTDGSYDEAAIKVYMYRLRLALRAVGANPACVCTVRGVGYRLDGELL